MNASLTVKMAPMLGVMIGIAPFAALPVRAQSTATGVNGLEEVIVTARYREESLAHIGESITAYTGEELVATGVTEFSDLARQTPALTFGYAGPGRNTPILRGVASQNTGQNDVLQTPQVVGTYFDDIPINSNTTSQRDVPFYDLDRVEVLRGPQGTLYGEGSMGGTIRYIGADPDLTALRLRAGASMNQTDEGGNGNSIDAAVSVPLVADRLGVRVAGFHRHDAGYVDNTLIPRNDFNDYDLDGGRVVLLAKPTDVLTMRLVVQHDESSSGGLPSTTGLPEDLRNSLLELPTTLEDRSTLVGARISYDFGPGSLTSISGYYKRSLNRNSFDVTFTDLARGPLGLTGDQVTLDLTNEDRTLSEELRYVSSLSGPFNFVAGLFYKDGSADSHPVDSSEHLLVYDSIISQDEEAFAAFGEVYYQMTPRLRLTGGLRYFDDRLTVTGSSKGGSFFSPQPFTQPPFERHMQVVLPKVALEFQMDEHTLWYGKVARGARNGGLNNFAAVQALPVEQRASGEGYGQDSIWSYELGTKTRLIDNRLSLDAAVFYSAWSDYQINLEIPGYFLPYVANAGDAHTQGVEGSLRWQMAKSLELIVGGAIIEAELDKITDPTAAGLFTPGTPLPNAPKRTLSSTLETTHPIGTASLLASVTYQYVSETSQQNLGSLQPIASYQLWSARVGLDFASWSITAFIDNIANDTVVLGYAGGNPETPLPFVTRPRTIGARFNFSY